MFKSDEDVEILLGHQNNNASVKIIGQGQDDRIDRRNSGIREKISTEQKANIGILAGIIGVKATSELTGKNQSQVSNFKNGKDSVGKVNLELTSEIDSLKSRIQGKALSKAEQFLEMLSLESDLSDSQKRASIAQSVVSIYEKLAPKNPVVNDNRTQIVFYAPRIKESSEYPIIEVEPTK